MSIPEGIIVGTFGGAAAGLVIWFVQLGREKLTEKKHKDRIYAWLYKRTKQYKGSTVGTPDDPRWRSAKEIASYANLTPDRVRYICSIHKQIRPKMEKDLWPQESLKEKWAIREFVDS